MSYIVHQMLVALVIIIKCLSCHLFAKTGMVTYKINFTIFFMVVNSVSHS